MNFKFKYLLPRNIADQVHWRRQIHGVDGYSYSDLERTYRNILSKINIDKIEHIRANFRQESNIDRESAAKYPEISFWLRLNIIRAVRLGLHICPPRKILDIGCGSGYFLFVLRQFGHSAVGLDLPDKMLTPTEAVIFNEMLGTFGERKVTHVIEPFVPTPPNLGKFDLITGFLVCFNGHKTEHEWGEEEWSFFVQDVAKLLNENGRLYLEFNSHPERYGEKIFYDHKTEARLRSFGQLSKHRFSANQLSIAEGARAQV